MPTVLTPPRPQGAPQPVARTRRRDLTTKLWTAVVHFDSKGTAEFHPERLDPVPALHLLKGRVHYIVLQLRCVFVDARSDYRHSDWLVTLGPRKGRKAIAKLLQDRKTDVETTLQQLCAISPPREGSSVGVALALVTNESGKPEWKAFIWFAQRVARPIAVSFPEWSLLLNPLEWWRRVTWWRTIRAAYKLVGELEDGWKQQAARIDFMLRPGFGRVMTSIFAAENQENAGFQRILGEYDVELTKTAAIPRDLPLDVLLALHEAEVAQQRRAVYEDLG